MNNNYKFDLQKFNREFNIIDDKIILDLKNKDNEYLSSKSYYDKKFNPFEYSTNIHIKYFIDNFIKIIDGKINIKDIINDDFILFHISIIMLFLSIFIYLYNKYI
jgi:hypothetical protein